MLGKIQPAHFPRLFGEDGRQALDYETVSDKFNEMAYRIGAATGTTPLPEQVAEGFIRIAVGNMMRAAPSFP